MKLQTLFAVTALSLVAVTAHAAPQEVVKLPRVVITGKATPTVAQVQQLPRVVVTGQAQHQVAQIQQLPRVVITGYSQETLARQAMAVAPTKLAMNKI